MLLVMTHKTPRQAPTEDLIVAFPCTIGRSSQNSIVIDDPTVAEYHAVIEQRESQLVFKDLGTGSESTFAGQHVGELVIDDNVSFSIGKVRVDFLLQTVHENATAGASAEPPAKAKNEPPATVSPKLLSRLSPKLSVLVAAKLGAIVAAVVIAQQFVFPSRELPVVVEARPQARAQSQIQPQSQVQAQPSSKARQPASIETVTGPQSAPEPAVTPELYPTKHLKPAPPSSLPPLNMTSPQSGQLPYRTPVDALKEIFVELPPWVLPLLVVSLYALLVALTKLFSKNFILKTSALRAGLWTFLTVLTIGFAWIGDDALKFNLDTVERNGLIDSCFAALVFLVATVGFFNTVFASLQAKLRVGLVLAATGALTAVAYQHIEQDYTRAPGFVSGIGYPLRSFDPASRSTEALFDEIDYNFRKIAAERPREFEFLTSSLED